MSPMFGLFKRSKIAEWEIELLKKVLQLLPPDYHHLERQVEEGLFRSVLIGLSDLPGYVCFTCNPNLVKKFENTKEKGYTLTGVKIFDVKSQTQLNYSIHVSSGMINGYSITGAKKFTVDLNKIDVQNFRKSYRQNPDYQKIEIYLNAEERDIINQDEVYEVVLNEKVYFHIKDLEDGDFIGIDYEKNIYKITHDPFEIRQLNCGLSSVLK